MKKSHNPRRLPGTTPLNWARGLELQCPKKIYGSDRWGFWPISYRRPQSAWLTAHKFGFLNAIDGRSLGRVLASVDPSGEHLPKSPPSPLRCRRGAQGFLGT